MSEHGHGRVSEERQPLLRHAPDNVDDGAVVQSTAPSIPSTMAVIGLTSRKILRIHALLVFLPLGFAAGHYGWHPVLVSAFNFIAILPLSALISDASDHLSDAWGAIVGALINATFGNAVEMIVGILSVQHGQIQLAQSMMLGSILSDILLVLGACLVTAAGLTKTKRFNEAVVDTMSSLMTVTAVALILPTVLYSSFPNTIDIGDKMLTFSRATAGVLLVVYCFFINFQMNTHKEIFEDESGGLEETESGRWQPVGADDNEVPNGVDGHLDENDEDPGDESSVGGGESTFETSKQAAILVFCAVSIGWCTHELIQSLDETARFLNITKTFVATILLPLVSNAPECFQVLVASHNNRINHAIGVIVGSILQIALFVLPFLVMWGWAIGQKMTLYFETSATCIIFLAVLLVNQVLQEGSYTYLHGTMLLSMYAIIALAYFVQSDH